MDGINDGNTDGSLFGLNEGSNVGSIEGLTEKVTDGFLEGKEEGPLHNWMLSLQRNLVGRRLHAAISPLPCRTQLGARPLPKSR
mmetsp:Transcript_22895/g.45768  ORF Transcript_22895/g.45768 Transcript_22895/m.45768 type:complete len:84 (+) Transcript_22895:703-954(+)